MTDTEKLKEAMALLEEVDAWMCEMEHPAPNKEWLPRLYALTGDHMILTDEGWEPGAHKDTYPADEIHREINPPLATP